MDAPDDSRVDPRGATDDRAAARHLAYMRYALALARRSPPRPTNYCVGAVLVEDVDPEADLGLADGDELPSLSTGYTLELPGNTHAEQCCLQKLAARHGVAEDALAGLDAAALPARLALYTTMEPCVARLSGQTPCVARILGLAAAGAAAAAAGGGSSPRRRITVYVGVREPDTFVAGNTGRQALEAAGVRVEHVGGLEAEILAVATAGHGGSRAE